MLNFLLAPENLAFAIALVLMVLLGAVEAVGLGSAAVHLDLDLDHDVGGHALDWLGVGRLPLIMLFVVLLACFALAGLTLQQIALGLGLGLLKPIVAIPIAFVAALPATAVAGRLVARVMPRDETTAVSLDTLVRQRATIVVGTARVGSPARARVRDAFGQHHYVLVEPHDGDHSFAEGEELLLVSRDGNLFKAIAATPRMFLEPGAPL